MRWLDVPSGSLLPTQRRSFILPNPTNDDQDVHDDVSEREETGLQEAWKTV